LTREWVRKYCMSLPHVTEQVQWKIDLVFKIGGKMFATLVLEPHPVCLAFKCSPEDFDELIERPGIIPAPYAARAKWVALESFDAMARKELEPRLKQAYELIFAKLPKKTQRALV
jgi:predicted DNA-binding protein (MmcQ/YjbR family)